MLLVHTVYIHVHVHKAPLGGHFQNINFIHVFSTQLRSVQQRIGYCPQFDALLERLTARELLTYYARLRGLPEKTVKGVVEAEIKHLDLVQYADRQCGTYR